MPTKKKSKKAASKSVLDMDLSHPLHKLANFLEQTRLADYMDLMQKPHKLAWLNFWAGVWRAFGFVIGGTLFIAIFILSLKAAVQHAGGLPWIGGEVEKIIAWILQVVEKRTGGE